MRRRVPRVVRRAPMAVLAGAAKRELDHMRLAHDDPELAAQRRHQRPVPLPRIGRQPPARSGEAGIPGGGEQVLDRNRQALERPDRHPGGKCGVGRLGDRARPAPAPKANRRAGARRSARAGRSPPRPIRRAVTRLSRKSRAISISGRKSSRSAWPLLWPYLSDLRLAFGDPGLHLVVIVGEIVLGDVVGGGGPDAVMAEDVSAAPRRDAWRRSAGRYCADAMTGT